MKVAVTATLAFVLHSAGAHATAQEVFTADVLLERTIVDESGATVSMAPPARFRLTESLAAERRVLSLTYLAAPGTSAAGPSADQLAGMRVELDEHEREVRVFDKRGRRLKVSDSPPAALPALPAAPAKRAMNSGAVAKRAHAADRLRELQTELGPAAGKVREHDRYLKRGDDETIEVLVLMPSAVPVEVNVVRAGILESHSTYEYEEDVDGTLLQRLARTETRIADRPGARSVMKMTYSNVTFGKVR